LLAVIAGFLTAVIAGTAIALAAGASGPVPPRKPLANAIHTALAAKAPVGITARITFTNHLIASSNFQGNDPVLTGASGRLWLSPSTHQLRLELQSDNGGGDAQVVVSQGRFWVYDPMAKTVYEGTVPKHGADRHDQHAGKLPTVARIQSALNRAMGHADLSGAIPSDVAGQPAYTIKVGPKHSAGLLGAGQLAWDAIRGVPLRIAIYARNESSPVLELKATDISYGRVPSSDFNVTPPSTAKVVKVAAPKSRSSTAGHLAKHHRDVSGLNAVASKLSFKPSAPAQLVGLKRRTVTLLDWGGKPAALVAYGQNLGGIAVIEQVAEKKNPTAPKAAQGGDRQGFSLPTVSINGVTGEELDTALGTMVRFTRNGVTYTVLGSVPPVAADQAARGL
jgi:hypothetical protein